MNRRHLLLASVPAALALTPLGSVAFKPSTVAAASPAVDARVEAVWPHDPDGNPAPVATAPLVNVEIYLFQRGSLAPVPCSFAGTPRLHYALNWETFGQGHGDVGEILPDEIMGQGPERQFLGKTARGPYEQRVTRTVNGRAFPAWVINDVPIGHSGPYIGPATTYFFIDVPGYDVRSNVWAHGADPRTFRPNQTTPIAVTATVPVEVDAIIKVVYPHDTTGKLVAVAQASLVNVAVDLFLHPLSLPGGPVPTAIGIDLGKSVWLLRSLNNGYLERVKPADQTVTYHGNVVWPRYIFNDVDVSAAKDPTNKYYFAVPVDGVITHTTIWAHGADARTYFPQRDAPTASVASCP